jgi:PAS domain S-box-containing protein
MAAMERQQLEEALQSAERRFQEALQSAHHILYRLNVQRGGYDYLSPFFEELTAHPLADFMKVTLDELPGYFHPEDRQRIFGEQGELAAALRARTGTSVDFLLEYRLRKADGSYCWLSDRNTAHFDDHGTLLCYVGSAYDITDRIETEQKLQASERNFRALFDSMLEGYACHEVIFDADGQAVDYRFLDVNPAFERLTGLRREQLLGRTILEVMPHTEPYWIENYGRVAASGIPAELESYARELDRHYRVKCYSPVRGQFIVIFEDVTEQKKALESIMRSEEQLRVLFEASHAGIILVDPSGRITVANQRMAEMFACSMEELVGSRYPDHLFPDEQGTGDELMRRLIRGEVDFVSTERHYTRKDGSDFWGLLSGRRHLDAAGDLISLVGHITDISERKRAEEERLKLEQQLLHAQKLESLGVLTGGIAHDFNNILTAIIGNADLALMRLTPESPARENLQQVKKAAARASDLARQMLAYSGKGRFIIEGIDMNRLIEEMGPMLEVSISKKAMLHYNLTRPLPLVEADATQLRQIIMNLVINAAEAIGDASGIIAVSTGCMECDEEYLRDALFTGPLPAGPYVCLEVIDTGCGMDRETQAKIFDPFFTTKFTGRGLGMAAVLGIIRGHRGAIRIQSEPGKGSRFTVLFPAGAESVEEAGVESEAGPWQGSGLVLLVDDEEGVRTIGSEMLSALGFDVITAVDGRDALQKFREHRDIGMVILDLTMPQMDGEQCFRELKAMDPTLRIFMSSGFSEHDVTTKFAGKGLAGFIPKPYKLSDLSRKLRESRAEEGTEPCR